MISKIFASIGLVYIAYKFMTNSGEQWDIAFLVSYSLANVMFTIRGQIIEKVADEMRKYDK